MNSRTSLAARVEQYLAERRRLGFELSHMGQALGRFARYVKARGHRGPLTVELMASWARQVKRGQADRVAAARALRMLRPFMRWLQQFDPSTEVPDEARFGSLPGRVAPHIFRDDEIAALLEAAAQIGPARGLRGAVMHTLFGLIACTGLRISEALALTDADVDLKAGVLTIRRSKFGKSRLVPLHPSTVAALCEVPRQAGSVRADRLGAAVLHRYPRPFARQPHRGSTSTPHLRAVAPTAGLGASRRTRCPAYPRSASQLRGAPPDALA